jgi:signal transduction histidine kinase/ligand-binding sensor domain-containing protein
LGKLYFSLLVALAHLWCSAPVFADELETQLRHEVLTTWTTDQGLPQSFITAIAQTKDGFLWVGTMSGLARFDGLHFRIFSHEGPPSLQDRIVGLARDGDEGLWIGTQHGLIHYTGGTFRTIAWKGNFDYQVDGLAHSPDGGVLVHEGGLLLRAVGERLEGIDLPVRAGRLRDFAEGKDGTIWVADGESIYALRGKAPPERYSLANASLLHADDFGQVFAGDGHHLFQFDGIRFAMVGAPGLGNFVSVMVDHQHNLWMASGGLHGLSCKSIAHTEFMTVSEGLASNDVRVLFEDNNHDVWIGTIAGLQRLHQGIFTSYTDQDGLPRGRSQSDAVFEDASGAIWVGTVEGGVAELKNGKWRRFGPGEGISLGQVLGFAEGQGAPVVAISDYGLFGWSRNRFSKIAGVPHGYVKSPVRDKDGSLWFGVLHKGLFRLQGSKLTHFGKAEGLSESTVWVVQPDGAGSMWAGTSDGLFRCTGQHCERQVATQGWVLSVAQCLNGRLLLGTSNGLMIIEGEKTKLITRDQGLPANTVLTAVEDEDENVWIATTNAIARITRKKLDAFLAGQAQELDSEVFTEADGLKSRDVLPLNQVNVLRAHDGRIWFATARGISVAAAHLAAEPAAQAVIDSTVVDDRQQPGQDLTIAPGRHRLTFNFTSPYMVAPEQLRFRYRLLGWDSNWVNARTAREASYTGLPPGKYRFEVMAVNREGLASPVPASVALRLEPFFWQTKPFIALALLVGIALVVEITRRQTRARAERLNLRFQERAAERERIASQIHDTVIQDMTGAVLQMELVSFQIADHPQTATQSLETLSARLRETIGRSRNMVSNLHSTAVPQNSLLDVLKHAEAEFRMGDEPQFRLISEGKPRMVHPLIRDEIYRICREALANAFRHAGARNVEVRIKFEPGILNLEISDDGQGMDEETKLRGRPGHFGLRGMEAHAQRIGASVTIESQAGKGTRIYLRAKTPSEKSIWPWRKGRADELEANLSDKADE